MKNQNGSDIPISNDSQETGIDPAPGAVGINQAPVRANLGLDAALDPDMAAGRKRANLPRMRRGPFANIEQVPPGHARHLGQFIDMVAGSHCRLHGEGTRHGDHEATQRSDENSFLTLVHLVTPDISVVGSTLPDPA